MHWINTSVQTALPPVYSNEKKKINPIETSVILYWWRSDGWSETPVLFSVRSRAGYDVHKVQNSTKKEKAKTYNSWALLGKSVYLHIYAINWSCGSIKSWRYRLAALAHPSECENVISVFLTVPWLLLLVRLVWVFL